MVTGYTIGECALCKETRRLEQDHDHATGMTRGRLCRRCNVCLGWFEKRSVAVITYVNAPQGIPYQLVLNSQNARYMRNARKRKREACPI